MPYIALNSPLAFNKITLYKALKTLRFKPLIIDLYIYINKETRILVVTYINDFFTLAKLSLKLE
jgi:hypothetical protein